MAKITVTIPDSKIAIVKAAILHHSGEENMTNAEAVAWMKERWVAETRQLVRKYQEAQHQAQFIYDDPSLE